VPTLTLGIAANHQAVLPALAALGALATVERNDAQSIGAALANLIASPDSRRALGTRSRALVDGQGATRVALALLARCAAGMQLRPVTHSDALTLWRWRNHPATRQASRQSHDISLEAHEAWLAGALADPRRRLRIAQIGPREVGVIRFDRRGDACELSLYLDPQLHGLGLGTVLLRRGEADLQSWLGPVTVHAEVLPSNSASRRLFTAAGYRADSPTNFSKTLIACANDTDASPGSTS
jgi:UDP-2,4-diacetamido-2,4,6-trideoxy-beta-L-altropyranose hydrolase